MPSPARLLLLSVSTSSAALFTAGTVSAQLLQPTSTGDRVLGLDVSAWQGEITTTEWATLHRPTDQTVNGIAGDGRDFVFIRSSRGGTTGYYNQSDPNNLNGENTLSQRYDDPYFVQNITRATNAGMLAGSYHFGRMDIIASTLNSGGIPNNGTDEADHFLQMAGAWMRPGYLLPVFDLEAGISQRTGEQLAQFALDFSNRIYQVKGIRPAVYIGGNYAHDIASESTAATRAALRATYTTLWSARWPNQSDPDSIPVQTAHPKDSFTNIYGVWDDPPAPVHPWTFWQYASTARLNGNNLGGSNTDVNVAQGNIEFLKDQQVPALWTSTTGGNWATLSNWNSGQTPEAPVQGPGQVARVGPLTLPAVRLPGAEDNVNLDRPNENVSITLSTAANVRRINIFEELNIVAGGALGARLTGQVGNGGTLSLSGGGSATFTEGYINGTGTLSFFGDGTLSVQKLFLANNNLGSFGTSGTAQIVAKPGAVNPAFDLTGGTRTITVFDGSAPTDMRIGLPLSNGHFTKAGIGTLELTGNNTAFTGTLLVSEGNLCLTNGNQIGTTGVSTGAAGSVQLAGNGLNIARAIRLGGRGVADGSQNVGAGALQNVSGSNTWSGNVVLVGGNHNQGQAGLNQISAAAGTTLTLSGVIQDNVSGVLRSWAKIGPGDVILAGASPNTYSNLTRVFDGRLIIEKNGALGATNPLDAGASTLQLANTNSVIAFRAPGGSPGLNYDQAEWIFTEGGGIGGVQLDNLGGANTFAGHIGLGGPSGAGGRQQAMIGVSAGSIELKGGLHARGTAGSVGPEARDIVKRGTGTLILSGTNSGGPTNAFARQLADGSTFTIEAGTVQLKGTAGNDANVHGIARWNINPGGLLSLSQGGAAGAAEVRLNGGTIRPEQSMFAANALTFVGNGTIDAPAVASSAIFGGNLSGNGNLTKSGLGNVFFSGAVNDFRGGVSVAGGMLGIAQNGGETGIANVNGLAIAGAARLDLGDNDLIIRTTPASAVEAFVAKGYAGGDWSGTGGIISSIAAANDWIYTLGVADNSQLGWTSFGGHAGLTGEETLVKYTYFGDADLSGVVNAADFQLFRAGFAREMDAAWLVGDFDYSGAVDGADFELYLFGFLNQPSTNVSGSFYGDLVTFAVDNGFDPTLVPEPSGAAMLALGAGLLLRRRRQRA
ncbi:MAG TPA: GH25 family lysozyme [Tepidisphaeraceae bacterium]|nr:GH25 family lysozyme [Tepidisphaeraceae bacterium]